MTSDNRTDRSLTDSLKSILHLANVAGITVKQVGGDTIQIEGDVDTYPTYGKRSCVLTMSNAFLERPVNKGQRKEASTKDLSKMDQLWVENIHCEPFEIKDTELEKLKASGEEENRLLTRKGIVKKKKSNGYENLTAEEMKELLRSLAETNTEYAFIVVVISTHGTVMREREIRQMEEVPSHSNESYDSEQSVQVFLGDDGKPVREKWMMEQFYNDMNQNLKDIPKFFILDYCRFEPEEKRKGGNQNKHIPEPLSLLPLRSDFIIAYATHRSHLAFEDKEGSWLIRAIAEVFGDHYQCKDVVNMLTIVNARIYALCKERSKKAMSVFESSLLKELRLWSSAEEDEITHKANPFRSHDEGSPEEGRCDNEGQQGSPAQSTGRKREMPRDDESSRGDSSSSKKKQKKYH